MYRWVVNDNPARNTRIMITICTPTMHDTIIRKMVRGSNISWKCTFLFPLEVTCFFPPLPSPSLSTPPAMMDRDLARTREFERGRKLTEFFRDSISKIIRRLFSEMKFYIYFVLVEILLIIIFRKEIYTSHTR